MNRLICLLTILNITGGSQGMELRVINYFIALVREGTITKAAQSLHLSQPTLSKQLQDLEDELGTTLFKRGKREIQLTEDGRYFFERAKEIQQLVSSTKRNLATNQEISGELTIGCGETEAFQLISEVVDTLQKQYSDILIHVYSGNAEDLLSKIDRGLIDFGLVIDPVDKQKYDFLQLPHQDRWGLLMRQDHAFANQSAISAKDLMQVFLLVSRQNQVKQQFSDWTGQAIFPQQIVGTYNLLYNASLLVQQGVGCALCIDGIINTKGTSLTFVPLSPPLTANVSLIWKKYQSFSPVAQEFLTCIKEKLSSISE
jgi:DNA-binding transcriptional LysR family regulator